MDTALVENENAKTFLEVVSKNNGINYPESYALLPIEASVIPNVHGGFQGFILDSNQLPLAVLPLEHTQVKLMLDKYVLPYFENKLGIKRKRLVLKYFGDLNSIKSTLEQAKAFDKNTFEYSLTELNGDVTIDLLFDAKLSVDVQNQIIRHIISNQKENVYAEFETSLGERLFDVLKIRKMKLAVAESFTGGRVVSSVISAPGASEVVDEGVVTYSNKSKMKRLGVSEKDLASHGAVSSVVAYQMAVGLLKNGADVAISTTGIAGPASDDTKKPVGLCYIAVGTKEGVHTYKYNLSGSREKITETAKNTALFLAIKKIKNL
jgi:nicotinamide-nucleotide amidase